MSNDRKADEYVVIRHKPGYRLRRALILLLLSSASAVGGYFIGSAEENFQPNKISEARDHLRGELEGVRERQTGMQQKLINLERGHTIDQQALNQTRRTIAALETKISELESDLTFYKNIMAPSETSKGLQVDRFNILTARDDRTFDFKLVLTQIGGNKNYISGLVAVNVIGIREGERELVALRDLSDDIDDLGVKFRFRYFQDVEGRMTVPPDFEPVEIQVVAQAQGPKSTQAERTFDWRKLTEN
ncbi:MAG: DUF6776 family protein [Marinobacter sp.]|uniref:DUF6776 family protein n=1 Tax=Marinobacter sp. TaxID=50741 RepID=UPI0034A0840E